MSGPFCLVAQACSALCSAASQYFTAVASRHSFSKPMFLFSVELLRLISSQHEKTLLSRCKPCNLALYIKYLRPVNLNFTQNCEKKPISDSFSRFIRYEIIHINKYTTISRKIKGKENKIKNFYD